MRSNLEIWLRRGLVALLAGLLGLCGYIVYRVDSSPPAVDYQAMLMDAIEAGYLPAADPEARQRDGKTPLHLVAEFSFPDAQARIASVLVEHGADLGVQDDKGRTPLHLAAMKGTGELVEFLLSAGADVTARDKDGCTPLHIAAWYGREDLVPVLLEAGAELNARDNDGHTPLGRAMLARRWELADILREHGATE